MKQSKCPSMVERIKKMKKIRLKQVKRYGTHTHMISHEKEGNPAK